LEVPSRPDSGGLEFKGNRYPFFQDISVPLEEGGALFFATPISNSWGFE